MEPSPEALSEIENRRHGSLASVVHRELEGMILRGALPSGERLNEQVLADRLGVSRGPVREAARLLQRDGLVRSVANQGVFVRQLSIEDAIELYELRSVLAGYACGWLAVRSSVEQRRELRLMVEEMQAAIDREDVDGYFSLNIEFHDRIAISAGNGRAGELYVGLGKEVRLLRRRVLHSVEALVTSNREHDAIVSAIENSNGNDAREAAEHHHLSGKRRWLETL